MRSNGSIAQMYTAIEFIHEAIEEGGKVRLWIREQPPLASRQYADTSAGLRALPPGRVPFFFNGDCIPHMARGVEFQERFRAGVDTHRIGSICHVRICGLAAVTMPFLGQSSTRSVQSERRLHLPFARFT